jgi:hypothetical protein
MWLEGRWVTMSKRSDTVSAEECIALGATQRRLEGYPNRTLSLGSLAISRALPVKDRALSDHGAFWTGSAP